MIDLKNPKEAVQYSLDLMAGHIPEFSSWSSRSFARISAIVTGALFWTALKEARDGIDRYTIWGASGEDLDRVASLPPYGIERLEGECDDDFRRRAMASITRQYFAGSVCHYQQILLTLDGVSRAEYQRYGLTDQMVVMFENKYPYPDPGEAKEGDLQGLYDYFVGECLTTPNNCMNFISGKSKTLDVQIQTKYEIEDIEVLNEDLSRWLRNTYTYGQAVEKCDVQCFFNVNYPQLGISVINGGWTVDDCLEVFNLADIEHVI